MTITHHPDDATLMSFAAGSLPGSLAAVVAGHAVLCPICAREIRLMESVGSALIGNLAPVAVDRPSPQMALRAMEAGIAGKQVIADDPDADVPMPLRALLGNRLDEVRWKRLGMGIWNVALPVAAKSEGDLRLLRVGPGCAVPEHGHNGCELTLILRGSYHDEFGDFYAGDVADLGDDAEHRPIAHPKDGCICLIASDRKARFKGLLGRLVQPLTGY